MRTRTRNLAALAILGTGLLSACSAYGSEGSTPVVDAAGAPAATSPAAAPASTSSTAAPASNTAGLPAARVATTKLGEVLVDAKGRTMYGFTNDAGGVSTCTGTCAKTWPPVIVTADFAQDASAKAANLHTVPREDGTLQLAAGKWPLYTFSGDSQAGDVNGQGSGGVWFVVKPDGSLQKSSTASPPTTSAPASSPAPKSSSAPTSTPPTTSAPNPRDPAPGGYGY